jgi:UDP-glucose 4-epimerase
MSIKRILITGSNSYVGTNVEKWLMKEPDKFYVETISVRGDAWKSFDFSKFDVVFHVAGIAHVSFKKNMKNSYYSINRDLTLEVAKKAKNSGVGHFIFMSSMIVYSSKETLITKDTKPHPDNFYGRSKLEAEELISPLQSSNFSVSIIRAPMIYGKKSKGNFNRLLGFAKNAIIFPIKLNKRSMLYINNLSRFVGSIISSKLEGFFYPQNIDYSNAYSIVKAVSVFQKRKIIFISFLNPFINFLVYQSGTINKLFSDFYYDKSLSNNIDTTLFTTFNDSIKEILE